MMKPVFSVIIPTLNEEEYLPRLLKALERQTYKDFEVIIVDASSEDKTIEEAKKFANKLSIRTFVVPKSNVATSRNYGATKAESSYFFFIDADNSLSTTLLEQVDQLRRKGNYSLYIPTARPDTHRLSHKLMYDFTNRFLTVMFFLGHPFSSGGNMVLSRSLFEKLHGFNEKLYLSEDHDIVKRSKKAGAKIALIQGTPLIVSARRFQKDNTSTIFKYFFATIYLMLFGKITRKIFSYPMGGHNFKKKD